MDFSFLAKRNRSNENCEKVFLSDFAPVIHL